MMMADPFTNAVNSPSVGTLSAVPENSSFQPSPDDDHNGQNGDRDPASYDEDDDEKSVEAVKPWDEGGPSDCGYSDTVHATLMTVGQTVHTVMGAPGHSIAKVQTSIGNWFQELSYATRDIWRGETQDAASAIKTVMTGGLAEDENDGATEDEVSVGERERHADSSGVDTSLS
jgi:hypothetical protein